jgi:hypothetical protein
MALRVPKAPGFASMMKEGSKYTHGMRYFRFKIFLIEKFYSQVLKKRSIVISMLVKNYAKQQHQVLVRMV